MKQSVRTGQDIYNEIRRLDEEYREIDRAIDEIDNEGSLPHRLLKEALENKRKELQQAQRTEYQVKVL